MRPPGVPFVPKADSPWRTWLRWIPAIAYAGLIFVASSMPQPIPYIPIPQIDKPIHFLEYAILCLLICWARYAQTPRPPEEDTARMPGGTTAPIIPLPPKADGSGKGEEDTLPSSSPLKGEGSVSVGWHGPLLSTTPGESPRPIKLAVSEANRKVVLFSIIASSLYGASDEFHQYFVPGRNAEVLDWVFDTAGALSAGFLWYRWRAF